MSQKYPYMNPGDGFLSQDMYADPYQRQSNTYLPNVRSSSQEQKCSTTSSSTTVDFPVHVSGMALSFLHSCGLDPSDLIHLAQIPEHLITVETLPKLLLQIKEDKLSSACSRPSKGQPLDDNLTPVWEGNSYSKPVEYPINRSAHPEQVKTRQDCWGDPQQTSSLTTGTSGSSSKRSSVPDYSFYKDNGSYCNTTDSSKSSSHSFVDFGPRPLLSLKLEPPALLPTRRQVSDFSCRTPPVFPHVCSLCDISVHSTKEWFFHVRGRKHVKRKLGLVRKYPKWNQIVESSRRNESSKVYKVPTRKEASDFIGTVPPVFPYLCVLCNITAFSEKDWSGHVTSGQHAKSQMDLMEKYPEWDGTVQSSRRNNGHTSTDRTDGPSKEHRSEMKIAQAKDKLSSRVVSFTSLPAGDGTASELTAIAKHFGSVKKSLFLPNQAYVEMSCLAEAKKLVEHYSANQLKLKGKLIQVTFSSEYTSLREAEGNDKTQAWCSHSTRRSSPGTRSIQRHSASPRRISSEKTHSIPNRRRSSERTHSSPKRKRSLERTHSSPKRRRSSERTHSSPKRYSSERVHSSRSRHIKELEHSCRSKEGSGSSLNSCHSSSFVVKNDSTKSSADTEEKRSVSNNYAEGMDSDSDLEGVEVIADDNEELMHDIDYYELSNQESLPSEPLDITDIHTEKQVKTGEDLPNADTSEASNSLKEGQKFEKQEDQEIKEEDYDLRKILENCVTLDEFTEENSSDCQEPDEAKSSISKTEESSDKTTTSTIHVFYTKQSGKESKSPKEENTSQTTAEPNASENREKEQDSERVTGELKETFGKVLEVRNLPSPEDYTDGDFMNVIKRYGDVTHHVLFRSCKKGFVEMVLASDAERVAAYSKNQDIALRGNILKIKVSEKYSYLQKGVESDSDDEESKKGEISDKSKNKQQNDELNGDTKSSDESLETDKPVGTEFVRPVVGYFCSLCSILYGSEEEAKDKHCRSLLHREKFKEHKERSGSVDNKK